MVNHPPTLPTEPIGSIPKPLELVEALRGFDEGRMGRRDLDRFMICAVQDTLTRFESTGSPMITDGEQSKPNFATYPLEGLPNLVTGGVAIPFETGQVYQLPLLTSGPFRFKTYALSYLREAAKLTSTPLKQAVISPSALSLIYPGGGIADYPREVFIEDVLNECESDIRNCLYAGAQKVQIDFTEGLLSRRLDPSGQFLRSSIGLNNQLLARFSRSERRRIGVHTCSGDVDHGELLPCLLALNAGSFYVPLARETNPDRVLELLRQSLRPGQTIFVGVVDPLNPRVETPGEVCERILTAARFIPVGQLGTTDDGGFSAFGNDRSISRATAFAKIRARVLGTKLASQELSPRHEGFVKIELHGTGPLHHVRRN